MTGLDVVRRNNVVITGRDDGTVVMLAHGFGCDQHLWRLVAPELSRDFRVVLFDYTLRPVGPVSLERGKVLVP